MTAGFLLDEGYGERHPVYWVEGAPRKSFFMGTKLRGQAVYVTETYRCTGCGLLQSYARERRP